MARRLPNMRSLEAFSAAARLGSFQAAAAALNLTPSAVSQRIAALERQLGTPLFERGPNAVVLNRCGSDLRANIDPPLSMLARAIETAARPGTPTPLVLAAPPVDAAHWLLAHIETFRKRHPELDLQIHASTAMADLQAGEADAALRSLPDASEDVPGLIRRRLYRETLVVVGAPDPVPSAETTRLRSQAAPEAWRTWDAAMVGASEPAPAWRYLDLTDDIHTLEAASQGLGLAIVHRLVARPWIESARLTQRYAPLVASGRSCYLVYPDRRGNSRAVEALRDWLVDSAAIEDPD